MLECYKGGRKGEKKEGRKGRKERRKKEKKEKIPAPHPPANPHCTISSRAKSQRMTGPKLHCLSLR